MKSKNIVFVHGLFGWGPGELGGIPYWGHAMEAFKEDFAVHEACCGPVSSFHDRACEVFAQIKGVPVDYGAQHSLNEGHKRTSKRFGGQCFVKDWSEDNPVILVGHSAGAQTCMQLQRLLAEDYWDCGSSAGWIEAIISIAGVLNGSTLPYLLGCDQSTGLLTGPVGHFLGKGVEVIGLAAQGPVKEFYDFKLDQWLGDKTPGNLEDLTSALSASRFAQGEDNLAFDLSLQGCWKANKQFTTHPDTYYLSFVTSQTRKEELFGRQVPEWGLNPLLALSGMYQGVFPGFNEPPIPGWGSGDLTAGKWQENDGAVSSISQRYPFTAGNHPVGGEGVLRREQLETGKWYWEKAEDSTGRRFDHLDVVFGCGLDNAMVEAHQALYRILCARLRDL